MEAVAVNGPVARHRLVRQRARLGAAHPEFGPGQRRRAAAIISSSGSTPIAAAPRWSSSATARPVPDEAETETGVVRLRHRSYELLNLSPGAWGG